MPYKREPDDHEIAALAETLKADWRPREAIQPWLREHGAELRRLIANKWTWSGLAKALTVAGITYQTGHPWKPRQLRNKVTLALAPAGPRGPAAGQPAAAQPANPWRGAASQGQAGGQPIAAGDARPSLTVQEPPPVPQAPSPRLHKIRLPAEKIIREPPRPRTPEEEAEYQRRLAEARRRWGYQAINRSGHW